ncbi:LOW QUALITY PROTEIN: uncharacterized protein ColSpa_11051 [Colletotrichum spaethianum]|uniref:Lipocalin-like domain-containing protein n=1 Tax=Colletotrichum spaethianum TaxID=700344 RepID=A0AA37PEL3_9PEZI|nr:LOW QUALITY PROTEIN: uncharacterized protein ColSpa_11051 [Colletotrichum spaethianum]GKT50870.1 LOW QUALITY PROTEIN: hypothetical protein ColSpa_11051 [Colletotrichum spaethianum]
MQPTEILAILAGTYQLLNTSATRDGVPVKDRTYGSNPVGILSYSKSGYMSATITSTDPEDRPANLTFPSRDGQSDSDWAIIVLDMQGLSQSPTQSKPLLLLANSSMAP